MTAPVGSSPRVRGKAIQGVFSKLWGGIIPAGAGKRRSLSPISVVDGDHPRGCGEKDTSLGDDRGLAGSSPRVRGKVMTRADPDKSLRIIPAGAGKSFRLVPSTNCVWDHPRGCGEKVPSSSQTSSTMGSSPRVRGKAKKTTDECGFTRIIPAGAGKSTSNGASYPSSKDHPRGCGEKMGRPRALPQARGSSPRVRGKGDANTRRCFI